MASVVSLLRIGFLAGAVAIATQAANSKPLGSPCHVSDEYLALNGKLDRAAKHLKDADGFQILVVGSSSTAGVGATAPTKAYTARLQEELSDRLPGVKISVVARGIGGETAVGAEERLPKEIAANKPDLVIWQIGTNDAAKKVDVEAFRKVAIEGLSEISQAGVDVAMLDPQFVAQDEGQYAPYIAAISAVSAATGVPVAHRFSAMRAVAKAGGPEMISRDRMHMNDAGHACVAAFLAEALDRKLAPPAPAVADVSGKQG